MTIEILPIREVKENFSSFDCGKPPLNDYPRRFAKQNDRKNISKGYLLIDIPRVLGYYTLSSAQLEPVQLPDRFRKGLPRYPVPAVRLGRLAVDSRYQGRRYGTFLLLNAMKRVWRASQEVAVFAMIVDAKDLSAKHFYERYGFVECEGHELQLFLPMKTLEELLSPAEAVLSSNLP